MATVLPNQLAVRKGISAATVTSIPQQWDAEWFKRFITNHAQYMDARNAVSGPGISVTGNISTTATISVSNEIQALALEPYLLAVAPTDTVLKDYRAVAVQTGVLSVTDGGAKGSLTVGVAGNGIGNQQLRQGTATSVIGNATNSLGNVADIVATSDNTVLQRAGDALAFSSVNLASIARIANNTVLGNVSGGLLAPAALTAAQLTTLINQFSATLSGAVPASGGGTINFLRADGSWAAPAYPTGANPSAQVGPAAVNGTAATFMTSDSAPAINLTASYPWTGTHTFAGAITTTTTSTLVSLGGGTFPELQFVNSSGGVDDKIWDFYADPTTFHGRLVNDARSAQQDWIQIVRNAVSITSVTFPQGVVTIGGTLGVNGATPPAQSTGWGTPTGASVQNNFSGSTATLAQTSAAVAELITVFKAVGFLGV